MSIGGAVFITGGVGDGGGIENLHAHFSGHTNTQQITPLSATVLVRSGREAAQTTTDTQTHTGNRESS